MAILQISNIPESLFERVKRIAAARGKSLDAIVIDLLEELDRTEVARQKHIELMQNIRDNMAKRNPLPDGLTVADIIRENREEREAACLMQWMMPWRKRLPLAWRLQPAKT